MRGGRTRSERITERITALIRGLFKNLGWRGQQKVVNERDE